MLSKYQPQQFEKKWAEEWKKAGVYKINKVIESIKSEEKPKFYTLVELPYTSGDLHIGHWFTLTHPDVLSRFKRMNGYNVFFPMGYDAFGLPAENAAIKRKTHPKDWTMKNIETMTKQFQQMGTMIDWDWMTITCQPEYYRWNQWIFLKLYEKGLAFRRKALSNWCPSCQTVIANENIENGKCWRCGETVVQKEVEQWFLKITDYAEQLIWPSSAEASEGKPDKPKIDWPKSVKVGQNNWIGKKTGINMDYPVKGSKETITCFTTAPVNFGMTFIVVAPEHKIVKKIINGEIKIDPKCKKEVEEYYKKAQEKTEMDRLTEGKEKTGVFTGLYATNRIAGWDVPVWVADFAIGHVGTGAVQGCPGHDYKDFEFAKKFNLPIIRVVTGEDGDQSEIKESRQVIIKGMKGKMVNSKFLDGLEFSEGLEKTMDYAEEKGWGKRVFSYHIRDWSISRQRYWGTPVPMIHCVGCGVVPVSEKELPVELPYEVDFTPRGMPPLATNKKWLNTKCPKCGKPAKRDPETLDTFFDSAWYWFRYLSPQYKEGPFDGERAKKLTPVDVYFGGAEHTLGHTLYARFFTKFFKSLGMVNQDEFALKRVQHGIVLGPDGNKMSKSKGNVINPDDVVAEYGSDTARLYLCFMMPYEGTGAWSTQTIAGVNRFLSRIWKIYQDYSVMVSLTNHDKNLEIKLKKTIKKVTEDIDNIKMNTSIAAMMEFLNDWEAACTTSEVVGALSQQYAKQFLQILAPFAPFMTEEIWRNIFGEKTSIHLSSWPKVERKIIEEEIVLPVQINGKLRTTIKLQNRNLTETTVMDMLIKDEKIQKYIGGKKYRVIYVQGKIINFIV